MGIVGLGVMGGNFALNVADKGFKVGVYDISEEQTRRFMTDKVDQRSIAPAYSPEELVTLIKPPRAILLSVPAGEPVDQAINQLADRLEVGDLIIDSGNSHFKDTDRREKSLSDQGIHFMGMGISGGEYGARYGPSMMPGGTEEAYSRIRHILEAAAAKVHGEPCVAYLGPRSAGHYVKMVHNGIEYGIMQLIAESYDLLKRGMGLNETKLASVYANWNEGELDSYLIQITADVLSHTDAKTGKPLVDMILDQARQKGTGKWTDWDALELQTPVPTIDAAVSMRNLSDYKEERLKAGKVLSGPSVTYQGNREDFIHQLERGLFAAVVLTYAQGLSLLRRASRSYTYHLNLENVARIWRGGCIIRAALLEDIAVEYSSQPGLENLILSPGLGKRVLDRQQDLRSVVCTGATIGIPLPGFMSALAYYDAYRSTRLPANLIMAQRDYFGSHRYERIDENGTFHTEWA